MKKSASGFTIVELLIVIVVIAILAAISIVAYTGIQNRAHDTAVHNDLNTLMKKQELFKIDNPSGLYAYGNTSPLAFNAQVSKSAYATDSTITFNLLICISSGSPASNYAILAVSKSGRRYYVSSASSGVQEYTGPVAWGDTDACTSVLPGSVGNGAGWAASGGWRAWAGNN